MGRKRPKKWMIIASVTAILVVGGSVTTYAAFAKPKSASTTTFRRVTAQTGNISTSVTGSGSVSDSSQLTLTAANAGTVDSLPIKQGDTVKAGQTIAHISSTASSQTVTQKQNQLTSAQNDLAQAKQQLESLSIKAPAAGRVKSIVASSGDDLSTIKPESVFISCFGGLTGVGIGFLASFLIPLFSSQQVSVSASVVAMAFAFSAAVGILFGFYPAAKASRLKPIDALYYE